MSRKVKSNYVKFDKNRNSYTVYYNGCQFTYSVNRYGCYEKKIAEKSLKDGLKYYDYFETDDNGNTVIFINTRAYGVKTVLIDTEDLCLFAKSKISVKKDKNTFYAETKNGKVHRIIMQPPNNMVVDHINRNGLDNRKNNLRIVDVSTNNRNTHIRKDNTSGYKNIVKNGYSYRVFYYDKNKNKCSKSFSIRKYGEKESLELAIDFRNKIYKEYNYIA